MTFDDWWMKAPDFEHQGDAAQAAWQASREAEQFHMAANELRAQLAEKDAEIDRLKAELSEVNDLLARVLVKSPRVAEGTTIVVEGATKNEFA